MSPLWPIHWAVLLAWACCGRAIHGRTEQTDLPPCDRLLPGQYVCHPVQIDLDTDQPLFCDGNGFALSFCTPIPGLLCQGLVNGTFARRTGESCAARKSFKTALLLAIFFGWAGLDRFYLGYVTIGLFKLCTVGFFFIFHLVDIILIALQVVQPSDGRPYSMDRYGPRVRRVAYTNRTRIRPANY